MTGKPTYENLEKKNKLLEEALRKLKQKEEALIASENKYRQLMMNSPVAIYEADYKTRRFINLNKIIPTMTGYSKEELLQMSPWDLFTEESQKIFHERLRLMKEGRNVSNAQEYSIRMKDGSIRWLNMTIDYDLEDGMPVRARVVAHDITDRKRTEEVLRESEEKYRGILANIDDSYYEVDLKGNYVFCNEAMITETGYSHAELMRMNYKQVISPDAHQHVQSVFAAVYKTGRSVRLLEYDFMKKDGTRRNLETWVSLMYDHKNQPMGFRGMARDVTERKQAEDALKTSRERLRQSEERYRTILENMEEAYYEVDLKGNYTFFNASAVRNLGYTREEMLGMNYRQYVDDGDQQKVFEAYHQVFMTGETVKGIDWLLKKKAGGKLPAEGSISLMRDTQGNPIGFRGVLRDISERKQAEKELRASEEQYRLLTENAMIGIFWIDDSFQFIYGNDPLCKILGRSRSEVLSLNFREVLSGASLQYVTDRYIRRQRGEEVPDQYEIEIVRPDGEMRHVEMMVSVMVDKNGKMNSIGQAIDITGRKHAEEARRASEERYRTIFESTATANIIVSEDSLILMANNNFADLCGYAKKELEGKMSWTAFIHQDDLESMKTYHKMRRIDSRSAPASYEFRLIDRQGKIRELFMNIAVIPGTTDRVASMVDLTERKQLEIQLVQAQKMESVGRLAGGVAHDFNNMLGVIIGNAEMVMNRVAPTEPIHKSLQNILKAAEKSADLTRQLLAFARKQTISPKVLDLNDMVTGMLKMLQRLIGENIDLGWHPGHDLWKVKIDPSQVDQLLANLMVNARDAIEKTGEILIETSNKICDEAYCADRPEWIPGEYVVLAVSDNGCGMDRETVANIFEPFFTTKKDGRGTGLGLATVYGIVRQNAGFINVYSEPGQGTTFRIYLPCYRMEAPETTYDKPEMETLKGTETILIVEDEESLLELSKEMLENLGYKVLAANGKDQALQLIREYDGSIDLLIIDVVIPEMNGKELSERILDIKPGMKCLFMSGYTADVIARQGILEEGVQFIPKPFSLKDMAAKVREVLGY